MDVVAVESTIRWATERLVTSDSERKRLSFAKDKELAFMTGVMDCENTVYTLAFVLLDYLRKISICNYKSALEKLRGRSVIDVTVLK